MDEKDEPFKEDINLDENIVTPESPKKNIINCILILTASILILIIIITLIIIMIPKDTPKRTSEKYLTFYCVYDVATNTTPTQLISPEFSENYTSFILINGTRHNFTKSFQFEKIGLTYIDIIIDNDEIKLDKLFKNIDTLISISIENHCNEKHYKIISMKSTFEGCINLKNVKISNINAEELKSMHRLFYNTNNLHRVNITNINTKNLEDISYIFAYSSFNRSYILNFDTSNVKNMSHMFYNADVKTNLYLAKLDTRNVKDMSYMFHGLNEITKLNLSNFDTAQVTNMSNMFYFCPSLKNITFSNKFITSNVIDMSNMFGICRDLENITLFNLDTKNVISMRNMFLDCYS